MWQAQTDTVMSRTNQEICGSSEGDPYNTPLHVVALVLILVLSTLGMNAICPWLYNSAEHH
jgi:hypothetical protein